MTGEQLKDPRWRLGNLYHCRMEGGGDVPFVPRAEQWEVFNHLLEHPEVPLYIIKSRRLGISTGIGTFMVDRANWEQMFRGLVIDQKQADATKKMVEIIRYAYDSQPRMIRNLHEKGDKRNDSVLVIRQRGEEEGKNSVIEATTGGRGGDCSMLWVSEWGPIAATDPTRSKEIRTGALPAASRAIRVVETTWAGGKGGDLWELVRPILEKDPNAKGRVLFFPWHCDPTATRDDGHVTPEIRRYFAELSLKLNKEFSDGRMKWYAAKKLEQGIFIKREYPSTLEEAFSAPVEGSIYGDVIMAIRGEGKICPFEWNRDFPVYAAWDIGWEDATTIWLWQLVGPDVHWVRYYEEKHAKASEMARLLVRGGIPVSAHFLPHDAFAKKPGEGKSYRDLLDAAGLMNMVPVPVCKSKWPGIDLLRGLLARSYFNVPATQQGLAALEAYHTKVAGTGGTLSRDPVHDWSSHAADAARYVAEAMINNLVQSAQARRTMVSVVPLLPDGRVVDGEQELARLVLPGRLKVKSGHSPL